MGQNYSIIVASSSKVSVERALTKLGLNFRKKLGAANFCTEPLVSEPDSRLSGFFTVKYLSYALYNVTQLARNTKTRPQNRNYLKFTGKPLHRLKWTNQNAAKKRSIETISDAKCIFRKI